MIALAIAHWEFTDTVYRHCTESWLLGEKKTLPHEESAPASVLCLAFRSDVLPTELSRSSLLHKILTHVWHWICLLLFQVCPDVTPTWHVRLRLGDICRTSVTSKWFHHAILSHDWRRLHAKRGLMPVAFNPLSAFCSFAQDAVFWYYLKVQLVWGCSPGYPSVHKKNGNELSRPGCNHHKTRLVLRTSPITALGRLNTHWVWDRNQFNDCLWRATGR